MSTTVEPPKDDLPVETIIIVACVCGGIVVILAIILGILCFRRHKNKKKYQQPQAGIRSPAPIPVVKANGHVSPGKGIINPGMDSMDMEDMNRSSVYTTDLAGNVHPHNGNYYNGGRNISNGYPHYGNGGPGWDDLPPPYDNNHHKYTPQHPDDDYKPYNLHTPTRRNKPPAELPADHPYHQGHNSSKEGSNGSDSGVSTPDPVKPRKVIYEVIV